MINGETGGFRKMYLVSPERSNYFLTTFMAKGSTNLSFILLGPESHVTYEIVVFGSFFGGEGHYFLSLRYQNKSFNNLRGLFCEGSRQYISK